MKAFMEQKGIVPSFIYSSEAQDAPRYREHLGIETILVDPERSFMNISGNQIRQIRSAIGTTSRPR